MKRDHPRYYCKFCDWSIQKYITRYGRIVNTYGYLRDHCLDQHPEEYCEIEDEVEDEYIEKEEDPEDNPTPLSF